LGVGWFPFFGGLLEKDFLIFARPFRVE